MRKRWAKLNPLGWLPGALPSCCVAAAFTSDPPSPLMAPLEKTRWLMKQPATHRRTMKCAGDKYRAIDRGLCCYSLAFRQGGSRTPQQSDLRAPDRRQLCSAHPMQIAEQRRPSLGWVMANMMQSKAGLQASGRPDEPKGERSTCVLLPLCHDPVFIRAAEMPVYGAAVPHPEYRRKVSDGSLLVC